MLVSSPAWLSAATSTLAYGVRKAGCPAVVACSLDSHVLAAGLAFSGSALGAVALPPVAYECVITDTSESSAGSMFQVSWSSWAQVAPAPSSVDRRPPAATELASLEVVRVFVQAPCCGVSMSGQIHAVWSCCGCELALPPSQYGRNVRAVAVYPPRGAVACTWSGKTSNRS